MRIALPVSTCLAFALLACSCSLSDSERCDKGQTYRENKCYDDSDGGADSETSTGEGTDTSGTDDGGVDGGDAGPDLPTGMNEPCTKQADCAGFEADYCAYDPINKKGACTVQNCKTSPDDCPEGYACCKFIESLSYPDFCMPDADWQEQHSAGICVD